MLNQALGPQKAKEVIDVLTQIAATNIARKADVQQLTNLLIGEHPQTIALIFVLYAAGQSGQRLHSFPIICRVESLNGSGRSQYVAFGDRTDRKKVIENKFSNYIENDTENVGGVHTLVEILNSVSRSTEKHLSTEKRQPELSNEVKSSLFTFEDIVTLDRLDVQSLARCSKRCVSLSA